MIYRHASVASTQDLGHELAASGAPHGTAVVAARQTGGRGTRGRSWKATEGGLWLSVVLRPDREDSVGLLSLRIGLAAARALEAATGITIGIKWPNDLMAREGKAGGILCESRWTGDRLGWLVAGIGLNVRNDVPADLPLPAVRLADLGFPGGPDDLAPLVRDAVLRAAEITGPLGPDELADFAARDWLRGRPLLGPVPGRAAGITPAGRLVIERPGGGRTETTDAVTLAPLAPGAPTR